MKKSKNLWLLFVSAGVLITAIVIVTAVIVSGRMKTDKYYRQITLAEQYMAEKNYDKVIEAYEAAIEFKPDEVSAYEALADVYMEKGDFKSAAYIAQLGFDRTQSRILVYLIQDIQNARISYIKAEKEITEPDDLQMYNDASDEMTVVRYDVISKVADYCFIEYEHDYGDAGIRKISKEEGYGAKFKGLAAEAYFKNSDETLEAIDEIRMKPQNKAKPYKLVLGSPTVLFVSYTGYVEKAHLDAMFDTKIIPAYDKESKKYYAVFNYGGCRFKLEVDGSGNMTGERPYIELGPLNLIKEDYEETQMQTETETEEANTFELGGTRYSYDVEEIYIYDTPLSDISPLSQCKNLKTLYLVDCGITDISPLAGCESLEKLCLDYNPFSDLTPLSGLKNLKYLQFHEAGVTDISPVMGLELEFFNPCSPGLDEAQVQAYKDAHPDCICYFDYIML